MAIWREPSLEELESRLDHIRRSPAEGGVLELIVRRPRVNEREVLEEAELHPAHGLVGDRWAAAPDPDVDRQLLLMNARAIAALAGDRSRWPLAGDQLFVDFDLSVGNLKVGTRLAIGSAVIELTEPPHTGCGKFASRFGVDATKFVNSPEGRRLRLRGVKAKVVTAGTIRAGDRVTKLTAGAADSPAVSAERGTAMLS